MAPHLDAPVRGAGPAGALGDPARRDLAGHRAAVPGQAVGAGQGAALHRAQHRGDAGGVRHRRLRGDRLRREPVAVQGPAQGRRPVDPGHPPARPEPGLGHLRAAAAGAWLLQRGERARRGPLPGQWREPRHGARGARARAERTRAGSAQLGEPAHRLHPRVRRDRRLRQPARCRQQPGHRQRGQAGVGGAGHPAEGRPDRPVPGRLPAAHLLRREQSAVLDRRQVGWQGRRARHPRGDRRLAADHEHLRRRGRRPGRRDLQQAALRVEVLRAEHRALEPGQRQLQDPLRPDPARAGAEGRAVADRRRRRLPGGRRRPGGVDRRRVHHHRQLPELREGLPLGHDLGLAAAAHGVRHLADRRDQLHAQLGQGDRGRVRRHRDALRVGPGPDPGRLVAGLPGGHPAEVRAGAAPGAAPAHALPRGPVQGAAAGAGVLPRDQREDLLRGLGPVEGARGPGEQDAEPAALPVVGPHADRRRRAGVLAHQRLRAAEAAEPRLVHLGGRRCGAQGLRQDPDPAAAQQHAGARPVADREPVRLRPADPGSAAGVHPDELQGAVRQPADPAGR